MKVFSIGVICDGATNMARLESALQEHVVGPVIFFKNEYDPMHAPRVKDTTNIINEAVDPGDSVCIVIPGRCYQPQLLTQIIAALVNLHTNVSTIICHQDEI